MISFKTFSFEFSIAAVGDIQSNKHSQMTKGSKTSKENNISYDILV
ncbi:MAG: hypothetical protein FWE22_00385 [Firmicutes bacterium]|nr:hypothetical protein [Bacillota bacterium]